MPRRSRKRSRYTDRRRTHSPVCASGSMAQLGQSWASFMPRPPPPAEAFSKPGSRSRAALRRLRCRHRFGEGHGRQVSCRTSALREPCRPSAGYVGRLIKAKLCSSTRRRNRRSRRTDAGMNRVGAGDRRSGQDRRDIQVARPRRRRAVQTVSSARRTFIACASAVECTATVLMPSCGRRDGCAPRSRRDWRSAPSRTLE